MVDFTADHISTDESRQLLAAMNAAVHDPRLEFVPGVSYRNLLLVRGDAQQPSPFTDGHADECPTRLDRSCRQR